MNVLTNIKIWKFVHTFCCEWPNSTFVNKTFYVKIVFFFPGLNFIEGHNIQGADDKLGQFLDQDI
jgi:hypothetical protein